MSKLRILLLSLIMVFTIKGQGVFVEPELYFPTVMDSIHVGEGSDILSIYYDQGIESFKIYSPTTSAINIDGISVAGYFHLVNNDADDISDGTTNKMFLATERTKLTGIETSATADQTASEILTLLKTVDGTGSLLDADLLDGIEASAFPLLAGTNTFTGANTFDLPMILTGQSDPAYGAGKLWFSTDTDALSFYNAEADVTMQLGQEHWVAVRNNSGADIPDFTPVYQTGATGHRANISLAKADNTTTAKVMGLTTHLIENNTNGYVTVVGVINGVDTDGSPYTETWTDAQEIFLSATTAGDMTNVAPTGDNYRVHLGHVLDAVNNGTFLVEVENGMAFPSSAVDDRISTFDGISGKRVQDSGTTITEVTTHIALVNEHLDWESVSVGTIDVSNLPIDGIGTQLTVNEAGTALEFGLASKYLHVRKASAGTITAGKPVYTVSYNVGGWIEVEEADADDPAKMPAIGLAYEDLTNSSTDRVLLFGNYINYDTSTPSWSVNDNIYVSATVGELTNVKPTGTAEVQKIGIVGRVNVNNGQIIVSGAGRSNDVPNIASAYFWLGNGSGVAIAVTMSGNATMDNAGAITVSNVSDADYGDITVTAGAWAVEDDSHNHTGLSAVLSIRDGGVEISGAPTDLDFLGADFILTDVANPDSVEISIADGALNDEYIELADAFVGDVTGTYGATVVGDDSHDHATTISGKSANVSDADFGDITVSAGSWAVEDDSHAHIYSNIDAFTEANLYTLLSDVSQFYESGDSPSFASITASGVLSVDGSGKSYIMGDVGFGETNPLYDIHLTRNNAVFALERDDATVVGANTIGRIIFVGGELGGADEVAEIKVEASSAWTDTDSPTELIFKTTPEDSLDAEEQMRIDSEGNVGIGIASPSFTLDVAGGARFTDQIRFNQSADSDGMVWYGFDDRSAENVQISINAQGNALAVASLDLVLSAQSVVAKLGDAVGVEFFEVKDSGNNVVASIDSDGNLSVDGNLEIGGTGTEQIYAYHATQNTLLQIESGDNTATIELTDPTGSSFISMSNANMYIGHNATGGSRAIKIEADEDVLFNNGDVTVANNFTHGSPSFSVYQADTSQSGITSGAYNKVRWDLKDSGADWNDTGFAIGAGGSGGATNSRFTPGVQGLYHFDCSIWLKAGSHVDEQLYAIILYINGAKKHENAIKYSGTGNFQSPMLSTTVFMDADDYAEIFIWQASGSTQRTVPSTEVTPLQNYTWWQGYKVQ